MLRHTRRRALALLLAACAGTSLAARVPRALAQDEKPDVNAEDDVAPEDEKPDCFGSKKIGQWTAQATDITAGATQRDVPSVDGRTCDLMLEFQVNTDFDARIFVEGDPDSTPLPEDFLVRPENRLLAKTADGNIAVDEALCGNCTDIYDDTVSIVLPLATAPLLRDEDSIEIALRLQGKDEDCRFSIDCVTMREALDWAAEQRDALAERRDSNECTSAEGCLITTACCEVLGLDDDCFELRTLRRYRDEVLSKMPDGALQIAHYYALAPSVLNRLRTMHPNPEGVLLSVYARFVLPAALAAWLGFNGLAYRLYSDMLKALNGADINRTPAGLARH